jgi:formylglycine-generating enzyme required for sulfatase activity
MAASGTGEKLKVFISYSRRDSTEFVDELVAGLEVAGFAPFIDRQDIAAGEKWEERLGGLIEQADTVVFVISPQSVKSERCAWEVERTLQQSKRLLPVVYKAVPEGDVPEQLGARQFVRFDGGAGFARPLGQLAEALRQDIDWIREHTRFGDLAARWEIRDRPDSLLLRGEDVAAVQAWAEKRKVDAPGITDAMRAFIAASKDADRIALAKSNAAQRRVLRMQALTIVLLVGVILALTGWTYQSYIADEWRFLTVTWPYARANVWPHVLTAAQEHALKPGDSFKECATDCPDMIVISAGSFVMGSPSTEQGRATGENPLHVSREDPQHTVTFSKPFAVSKYELTFADWDACVAAGGCNDYRPSDTGWGRGQQPVINVSWEDAQQYVAWLSEVTGKTYRLLSESEYEYATRAGTTTAYPWGDDVGKNNANCNGCGSRWDAKQTAPVGSFTPNRFGLYDMAGNIFEWTEDCVHDSYDGAPIDGSAWLAGSGGDCTNRVVRGGSWLSDPEYLRSADRIWLSSSGRRDSGLGFRVARTLVAP